MYITRNDLNNHGKKLTAKNVAAAAATPISDPKYITNAAMLDAMLNAHPDNTDRNIVLMKILAVDYCYSTRLHTYIDEVHISQIADNIVGCKNFDDLVKNGDPDAVEVILKGLKKSLLSFATKYCVVHNRYIYKGDDYYIYDSAIVNLVPLYSHSVTKSEMHDFRNKKDYKGFSKAMDDVLNGIGITGNTPRKDFDRFIWQQYKEITKIKHQQQHP